MNDTSLRMGSLVAKVPIIQGGMGVGISLGSLAGAVAREGGIGVISAAQIGFREPDFEKHPVECNLRAIFREYEKARALAPDGIIGFNIMVALKYYEDYVRAAVKAGADLIISGAGLPTELPAYVEGSRTRIAPIVSTEKSARVILKYWDRKFHRTADLVIIEGPLAGGHLGFTEEQTDFYTTDRYEEEIRRICDAVREYGNQYGVEIPVAAAGGIYTAEDRERVMRLGVQGVQVGSRFVTTVECDAHRAYKEAYLGAAREDVTLVKSPVGMPGRALKNPFLERVMAGEKFPPKKCLGCLKSCNPAEIPYCITEALIHAALGEMDRALVFGGAKAWKADHLETVKEVIDSLMQRK